MSCQDCGYWPLDKVGKKNFCSRCGLIVGTAITRQKHPKTNSKTKSSKNKNHCLACQTKNNLTKHHIIPQRIKSKTQKVILCRGCHNIADRMADSLYPSKIKIETMGNIQ